MSEFVLAGGSPFYERPRITLAEEEVIFALAALGLSNRDELEAETGYDADYAHLNTKHLVNAGHAVSQETDAEGQRHPRGMRWYDLSDIGRTKTLRHIATKLIRVETSFDQLGEDLDLSGEPGKAGDSEAYDYMTSPFTEEVMIALLGRVLSIPEIGEATGLHRRIDHSLSTLISADLVDVDQLGPEEPPTELSMGRPPLDFFALTEEAEHMMILHLTAKAIRMQRALHGLIGLR
jgi:hypothetical protein